MAQGWKAVWGGVRQSGDQQQRWFGSWNCAAIGGRALRDWLYVSFFLCFSRTSTNGTLARTLTHGSIEPYDVERRYLWFSNNSSTSRPWNSRRRTVKCGQKRIEGFYNLMLNYSYRWKGAKPYQALPVRRETEHGFSARGILLGKRCTGHAPRIPLTFISQPAQWLVMKAKKTVHKQTKMTQLIHRIRERIKINF